MTALRKGLAAAGVLAGLSLSGCATTEYVDEQIAGVNARITALEGTVQQVDGKAQAALTEAQAASGAAQQANQRLDALTGRVDSIEQRMVAPQAAAQLIVPALGTNQLIADLDLLQPPWTGSPGRTR